ncbi:Deoxyribodipyrimidine photo-lyase [Arsenophonus endosymbiont of Aleurodicus floccissimus]|uniref:deoxyribodipyrimidine photo-lyase n=1 Tax=Arsenophonus endosymbiont of Aleurodicus floccissimus TaxID=2152761 RepID=UPI000E6AF5DE|nr:deoxyribodipyrimidine photo-lyase [Arsenophonus endosymbiont of Aleurodicus floccissimus]SPP32659.1 Deoxyribodipyrimidine photo-lyase [Arsenophonus endosymbiont of Aleurodicus floccissimus]
MTRLVWFRNDLRITDNTALFNACQDQYVKIIAVYMATPKQWQKHHISVRQIAFIHDNLIKLQHGLAELGIPLIYQQCADFSASLDWLREFCQKEKISEVFFNRQYEFNELRRDQQLEYIIGNKVVIRSFDDSVLLSPGSVLNVNNEMYKVFTPFSYAFIKQLIKTEVCSLPAPKMRKGGGVSINPILPYLNDIYKSEAFPSGEKVALAKLRNFCRENVKNYQKTRDIPAIDGTSCLSPYLAVGVLSPRQCFNRLRTEHPNLLENRDGAFIWLNELIWREFYHHLIVAHPFLCKNKPFIDWTDRVQWKNDEAMLLAWQQGLTGYPIVDAGMRQLNKTGWMHNRLRMITASFLVKDLLIDWRKGEHYFMTQLLDGDFAANNGGWQWAASTGTDAMPHFRIFNPTTQGKRFDPNGIFIRRWLPELNQVPDKYIHIPHLCAEENQTTLDYPLPIIDHSKARKETLEAFSSAKNMK